MADKTPRPITTCALLALALATWGCGSQPKTSELERARASLAARNHPDVIAAADTYLARTPRGPHAAEAHYLKGRAFEDMAAANPGEARNNLQQARTAYIAALKTGIKDKLLEGNIRASLADVAYWQDDYATAAEQWIASYSMLEDDSVKSWALYRAGVSQQRLAHYDKADKTLQMVVAQHPDTEPARRAQSRIGVRGFHVQVATFADRQRAAIQSQNLNKSGLPTTLRALPDGKTVLLIGPYPQYGQAVGIRARMVQAYPDALITP